MKKLLSLLTVMLFLLTGKAIAQVTIPETTTDDNNPTYYVLKSYRSGAYLIADPTSGLAQNKTLSDASLWYFKGNKSDGVFSGQIGNKTKNTTEIQYLYRNNENKYSFSAEGLTWYVQANKYPATDPKGVVISTKEDMSNSSCIDASKDGITVTNWSPAYNDWDGTTWIAQTLEDAYNEAKNKAESLSQTGNGEYGFPVEEAYINLQEALTNNPTPTTPELYISSINNLNNAITTFNQADIKKIENGYYKFECQNSDYKTFFSVNTFGALENIEENIIVAEQNKENPALSSIWYLESMNEDNTQFTFKNAATGEYLNNIGLSYGDNTVFTTSKLPKTISITYKYKTELGIGNIAIKGNNITLFLNGKYPISYGDGIGSVWKPILVSEADLNPYITEDQISLLENWYTKETTTAPVYLGYNSYNLPLATAEKETLLSNKNYANYRTYMTKVEGSVQTPKENTLYYIVSSFKNFTDGKTRAIYFDENANSPKWKICENNEAPMLWKLKSRINENNPNGISICNANNGKYISGTGYGGLFPWNDNEYAWSLVTSPNGSGLEGTNFNLVHDPNADGNRQTMAMQANSIASPTMEELDGTITCYNSNGATAATHWQIIEAKSVNLKTNNVTEGNWGTTYLPVTVQLPEGARGFYVSSTTNESENSVANLTEVTDRIVPAENGALIYSDNADENGYITASIVYNSEVANLEGNLLQGSLAGTNVPENGYILTRKESHGLGFYKINPDNSKIAGNKAYLVPESGMSQIQAFSFNFDGEGDTTTDIENTVVNENTTKVYYDLQGRRVLNPTKGIYITNDGKKVIFNK